jgi:hypothetical protein
MVMDFPKHCERTYEMQNKVGRTEYSRGWLTIAAGLAFVCGGVAVGAHAQDAAAAQSTAQKAPGASGTIKSTGTTSLVMTTAAGQDVSVTVSDSTKFLIVPPGSKNLSAATPGSIVDAATGDKALVTGKVGDTAGSLNAVRIILMKSADIEKVHQADAAAWARGGGGIVKSVDAATGVITISSGMRTISVQTTPTTIFRRYSDGSIKFEDAVQSTVSAIQPGDQMRVRGTRSADNASIAADEIVTGAFKNFSGIIASIDSTAGTITLKDLTTKKTVVVAVTPNSDVRRLPLQMANMLAMRMRGGAAGAGGAGAPNGGARPTGAPAGGQGGPGGPGGGQGGANAGADLSRMLTRLPTETLGGLKVGEAVMIVASSPAGESSKGTAITLLVGVDPILAAPAGQSTTLSPWSMGGGEGGGDAGGMGGGPGR